MGTGNYQKGKYQLKDAGCINDVYFVQEALIRLCCNDFTSQDTICILLTAAAKKNHWITNEKTGLQEIITDITANMKEPPTVKPIDIPDGKNEQEIWNIFDTVYELLNDNDEIIFDITHGFRSLPMLFFAVLNYARYLKNISVKAIYYGAWDARDTATNTAPIFNLTPFYSLLQWGNAADAFLNYGHTDKLATLISESAATHIGSKKAGNSLHYTFKELSSVRGKEITDGKIFINSVHSITELEEKESFSAHPAFQKFFTQIKSVFSPFKENAPENFIPAAELHLKHGREQQAITLLQEGLLTYLIHRHGGDWQDRAIREVCAWYINAAIKAKKNNSLLDKTNTPYKENAAAHKIGEEMQQDPLFKEIIAEDIYHKLTILRNDINHGGYKKESMAWGSIVRNAKDYYNELKQLYEKYGATVEKNTDFSDTM